MHEEDPGLDEQGMLALALKLREMAGWLGLERVQLNCQRPSADRLRVAMLNLDVDL